MRVNLLQGTYTPLTHAHAGRTQGYGADCLQRPLIPRSRFRQRLIPGVRKQQTESILRIRVMRRALTGIFIGIAVLGLLCGGLYVLGTRQIAAREPEQLSQVGNRISGRFLEVHGRRTGPHEASRKRRALVRGTAAQQNRTEQDDGVSCGFQHTIPGFNRPTADASAAVSNTAPGKLPLSPPGRRSRW